MIKKAIDLGVAKINVNTECQLSFADATRKYIEAGKDQEGKGYDPRKLLKPGYRSNHRNCQGEDGIIRICWKSRIISIYTCLFQTIELY